jgi:Ca2+-binding EF-hand superfamily protein
MMNASIYGLLMIFTGCLTASAEPPGGDGVPEREVRLHGERADRRQEKRAKPGAEPRRQHREGHPEAGGRRPHAPGERGPKMPGHDGWRRLDRDGDGRVSYEEFATNKRLENVPAKRKRMLFKRIDKNGDGWIQPREMMPPGHGPRGRGMRLHELDTNRDGVIRYREFARGRMVARLPEEKRRALFKRMDRNGDGVLSPLDRPDRGGPHPPHPPHPPHSWQGPGPRPPRQDAHPPRRHHPPLAELDRDGSGGVDFREFSSGDPQSKMPEKRRRAWFDRLDRNGDGKIRRNEMPDRGKAKGAKPPKNGKGMGKAPRVPPPGAV